MITFGFVDVIVLFLGWFVLYNIMPDDLLKEIGCIIGTLIMMIWFVVWLVLFPIFHLHVTVGFL